MLTADLIGAASLLKIDFFLYWLENSSVDPNVLLKISPMETARVVINSFFFLYSFNFLILPTNLLNYNYKSLHLPKSMAKEKD